MLSLFIRNTYRRSFQIASLANRYQIANNKTLSQKKKMLYEPIKKQESLKKSIDAIK